MLVVEEDEDRLEYPLFVLECECVFVFVYVELLFILYCMSVVDVHPVVNKLDATRADMWDMDCICLAIV